MGDDARVEILRRAAAAKREVALRQAEAGLRKLTKARGEITFRAVAKAAGVSVDFLYRHPELRSRIERLRAQQQARAGRHPVRAVGEEQASQSSVVRTLTARLVETQRELAEVKAQLAAAHGELLVMRRQLSSSSPAPPLQRGSC